MSLIFQCSREVLNGVGVDFFPSFFAFSFFLSLFFASLRFPSFFSYCPRGQGQTTAIYCKHGEFHSDPVCTNPVQNDPIFSSAQGFPSVAKLEIKNLLCERFRRAFRNLLWQFRAEHCFRNKNSAQRGSFGPDIPADVPPKTSVRPSKSWKNKHVGTHIRRGRP